MKKRYSSSFWTLVMLIAVIGMLGSVGSLLLGLVLPSDLETQDDLTKTAFNVIGLLGLGFSLLLLGVGIRGRNERPSPVFFTPRGWIAPLMLWFGLIALIFIAPGLQQRPFILAGLHVILITLPAFLVLILTTLAAGNTLSLRAREITTAVIGGILSILPSFILEVICFLLSLILVLFVALMIPGGTTEVERIFTELQLLSQMDPTTIPETRVLALVGSPIVIAILILTLSVATPIIEELGKTAIVAIFGYRERFNLRRAFLWGAISGLGFAIVEGSLNGLMSIGGPTTGWISGVAARAAATGMHAFTSGLTGLGWGYFWQKRRRWMLPVLYLIAIFFHGLWNFSTISMIAATPPPNGVVSASKTVITLLGTGLLIVLALTAPAGLIGLPLFLRRRAKQDDTSTPESVAGTSKA